MTFTIYHLASATCVGAGTGIIGAALYMNSALNDAYRLVRYTRDMLKFSEKESDDLRLVIASQRQKISKFTNIVTMNGDYGKVGTPPQETQMCGGCGAYLTQEEMDKCPGEACPRYALPHAEQTLPLFEGDTGTYTFDIGEAMMQSERKINIGYTGHLHTTKKPL